MAQQTRDDVPYVRSVAQTSSHTKVGARGYRPLQ